MQAGDNCGSMKIDNDWYPVVTEDPERIYAPNKAVSWMYVPNAPATIIDNGKRVLFWVTPVFYRMWYTRCNLGDVETIKQCEQSVKHNPLFAKSSHLTGLAGKTESVNAGLKCYGASCLADPSRVCASLKSPRLGEAPGFVRNIKHEGGKIAAVEYSFLADFIFSADNFRQVMALTYDGADLAKFIPKNIGVYLLSVYCMRKEWSGPRKGDYFMFTRKECEDIKYVSRDAYSDILNTLCQGKDLHESKCRTFCGERNTNCDARIEAHCKSLSPKEALNTQNSDLCGCFMGNQFYKGYFDELKKKFNFPITAPPSHVCYFDMCASTNVKPYNEKQNPTRCPDVISCFQNVNVVFDGNGNVINGDIIVKQDQQCGVIQRKCSSKNDCQKESTNTECISGVCANPNAPPPSPQPPQPVPSPPQGPDGCGHWETRIDGKCVRVPGQCLFNSQCVGSGVCTNNKCVPQTPVTNTTLAVLASVAAAGILAIAFS